METLGIIHKIMDTQRVSERFKQREVVLKTEIYLPESPIVTFMLQNENCELADKFKEGDKVKVEFELKGREWNGPHGVKYFNTLVITAIEHE